MEIPHSSMEAFYKRLQSEFRHLKNGLPREILSFSIVNENDLQHYEAKILGPDGTPYENGIFALNIYLPRTPHVNNKSFPFVPPEMKFKTTVFHPNISSKGDICLDILNCQWNPSQSFVTTLLSICSLLSDPNINDFLVPEAAFLYKVNRQEYDRKAREWTRKYATAGDVAIEAEQDSNRVSPLN
jgi:ubiquitin-conjugating enzyme E2 D/E